MNDLRFDLVKIDSDQPGLHAIGMDLALAIQRRTVCRDTP